MKFLVKINFCLYLFFNILFCSDCLEQWYSKNLNDKNKIIYLEILVNNNKLNFFQYKENIKIKTNDYTLLLNDEKTSKYIFKTNQLLIDFPDKKFKRYIKKIIDIKKNLKKFKPIDSNIYSLKKINGIDTMNLYFNDNCSSLDSILVKDKKLTLNISNIKINFLNKDSFDSTFAFYDLDKNVKKYDFRFEK